MRVIAGSARGTRLEVASTPGLRPTGDRQRETLFNVIRDHIEGAAVLDLFAGSGALGIEALSRGADSCVFVERSRRAARTLQANLERCRVSERGRVVASDWRAALRRLAAESARFDLLLLDPPWALDETGAWLGGLAPLAHDAALLCLERQRGEPPAAEARWRQVRSLGVGDTAFHLFECGVSGDADC